MQIVRVLLHEPVARLVGRDVVFRELLDALGDGAHQAGVRLHLTDRRVHDRVERAVHEARDEVGKIDLVAEGAGALRNRFGGLLLSRTRLGDIGPVRLDRISLRR